MPPAPEPAPPGPTPAEIARTLDHALLQPRTTRAQLDAGYDLAARLGVASVCVMPFDLPRCAAALAGTGVAPSTVIGFPHGVHAPAAKAFEAEIALAAGATELDMVINLAAAASGDLAAVGEDIAAVLAPVRAHGARLKVILETGHLDEPEIRALCAVASDLGADWVKTSTGFGPRGASEEDVRTMRDACPPAVQIKASGGIRTLERVLRFRELGCTRCGTSSTEAIMAEARERLG